MHPDQADAAGAEWPYSCPRPDTERVDHDRSDLAVFERVAGESARVTKIDLGAPARTLDDSHRACRRHSSAARIATAGHTDVARDDTIDCATWLRSRRRGCEKDECRDDYSHSAHSNFPSRLSHCRASA